MIDVLIITKNEEANIGHCLDALAGWTNRVFVVDSGSTDATESIVREKGAEFVPHDWEGYARQKNWALDNLPFEAEWTLIVDADEEITPELRDELVAVAKRDPDSVPERGFYINRRQYFLGRPMNHCYYPSWNMRFFKRGAARYEERVVHEHMLVEGETGRIRPPMKHWDRRGLAHYIAKHNDYSTLEAIAVVRERRGVETSVKASPFGHATSRRRWIKLNVLRRAPVPWLGRFLHMYILKRGILDGFLGLQFSIFIASYELLIALKLDEIEDGGDEALAIACEATGVKQ